jgi:hypothetical protein
LIAQLYVLRGFWPDINIDECISDWGTVEIAPALMRMKNKKYPDELLFFQKISLILRGF